MELHTNFFYTLVGSEILAATRSHTKGDTGADFGRNTYASLSYAHEEEHLMEALRLLHTYMDMFRRWNESYIGAIEAAMWTCWTMMETPHWGYLYWELYELMESI